MKLIRTIILGFAGLAAGRLEAEDFLDRVDEALTFSAFGDKARARVSGLIDLEGYYFQQPAPGLIYTDADALFNPRFSFFVDAQLGGKIYLFSQSRVDTGFDPSDHPFEARMDEYALRVTPWDDGRLSAQVGKYATVVGNWVPRHLSWENPFITAPLPYEHVTAVSDYEAPAYNYGYLTMHSGDKYEYLPLIWGPSYATGASVAGKLGRVDYAAEVKNSSLSSRPESWDATSVGFRHPTLSSRLGFRPNVMWNLGLSGSAGSYLRSEGESTLPSGTGIGDYQEYVIGQDLSFAWRHLQIWVEFFEGRFEVPRFGNADVFSYYLEAKYKFTPQLFGALRWNQQLYGDMPDRGYGMVRWGRDICRTDLALGYRFTAHTQLKLQYSVARQDEAEREADQMVAAQFTVRY